MHTPPLEYDTQLAERAPAVTLSQRQEGYDTAPLAPSWRSTRGGSQIELHRLDTYVFPNRGPGTGSPATPSPASSKMLGSGPYMPPTRQDVHEPIPISTSARSRPRHRCWIWTTFGIALVVIVTGVVVGAVISTRHKSDSGSQSTTDDSAPPDPPPPATSTSPAGGAAQGQEQASQTLTTSGVFATSSAGASESDPDADQGIAGVGEISLPAVSGSVAHAQTQTPDIESTSISPNATPTNPEPRRVPRSHSYSRAAAGRRRSPRLAPVS